MIELWNQLLNIILPSSIYLEAAQRLDSLAALKSVKGEICESGYVIRGIFYHMHQEIVCEIRLSDQLELAGYQCSKSESQYIYIGAMLIFLTNGASKDFPFEEYNGHFDDKQEKYAAISNEVENKRIIEMTYKSRSLIDQAKKDYLIELEGLLDDGSIELRPSLVLNGTSYPSISYQVGKDKLYVVKNLTEFICRIDNREDHFYGKNLKFVHSLAAFSDSAKAQIDYIRGFIDDDIDYSYFFSFNGPGRTIDLDRSTIDDFFDFYQDFDTVNFSCQESEDKIRIEVQEDKKTYTFIPHFLGYLCAGEKYYYQLDAQYGQVTVYRYRFDEAGKAIQFLDMLRTEPLMVMKSEYADFYKYFLSDIEKYFEIDSQAESIEMASIANMQLYVDIDESNHVVVSLKCFNEDNKFWWGFNKQFIPSYGQDLIEHVIEKYASSVDYDNHRAIIPSDEEELFDFMQLALPKIASFCEIYVSDELKNVGKNHGYSISVGVRLSSGLLEIDIESPDIPKEELGQVLNAYRRKKKFYRLKNGKLVFLDSDDLEELNRFTQDYQIAPAQISDIASIPAYRMIDLENKENELKNISLKRDEMLEKAMQAWHEDTVENNPLLPKYDHLLRSYQKSGVQWMAKLKHYQFGGILADDMGLGKTLQVIALLDGLEEKGINIVVCPASLIYNWEEEIQKFSSSLKTICITGNVEQRKERIGQYQDYELFITSYDYIKRDIELYDNMQFNYIILDEAQYIKNHKTKNATSVKRLKGKNRLALTGTPIENSLAELWSIFDFLMPGYLYNYHHFQRNYETDIVKYKDMEKQVKLKKLVSPFILRRNKSEVLTELPDKIETNYLIDFNEEEKKLYYATLAQANNELAALTSVETVDKIVVLKILLKLRQICCEPRLIYENIDKLSSKLQACLELIESLKENNKKVLLFSSFTTMLDLIADELEKRDISFLKLTGATNKEDRRKMVDQFQNDNTTVFLISLKAGGTGLNLTAAEAVIHYDPWWNISAQNQATDRAYRIGQNKNVQVFKMVVKNSIEEKIQNLQQVKKDLADAFVEGNVGTIGQMSKDEIMSLFKMD